MSDPTVSPRLRAPFALAAARLSIKHALHHLKWGEPGDALALAQIARSELADAILVLTSLAESEEASRA